MDLGLSGKIALVCGASQGLGFATAKELSKEGCTVIICSRDRTRIQRAAKKIETETGGKVYADQVDLSQTDQVIRFANLVVSEFENIDILVNNSGGPPAGFFADFTEPDWLAACQNTLLSAVTMTRQILPLMVNNNWGRIINLTSLTVKQPVDNLLLSNSIRMALVGWAKTLSNQYARHNITVNNIATGYTLTERLRNLAKNISQQDHVSYDEVISRWMNQIPAKRLAHPQEIAWLVTFLASEKAAYITGTTIPVDGGVVQNML
ncbi:MAG: SDR family oxidoreductase [bacterium]|nr:MAG: SDR family oxidoreductase [bacterium]